jgi:hypothetical protein
MPHCEALPNQRNLQIMRVLALLAFSASAFMAPALASADPGQPQVTPAASAQTAPAAPATVQSAPVATPVQAPPAGQVNTAVNLNEVVCRSSPPTTGTRLGGGRECHSMREWNERQQEAQRMLQLEQNTGLNNRGK